MSGDTFFKRTGDADYPKHLNILLQGPPKSGKTTFLSTAPNVVIAACEAGLMTIAHLDVPFVTIDSTAKLQQLEMILRDDTLRAQAARQLGVEKIETVAIDTLDAWQELLKKEIMAENRRTAFQRDDWGTLKERMAAILKAFTTLPVNVIFTVHTTTVQDEESRLIYAPALQGSIKDEIAGLVDFSLGSFRLRETGPDGVARTNYYLKTEGDLKNPHLGSRASGRLPEIVRPDFQLLHDAVFNAVPTRTVAAPLPAPVAAADVPAIVPAKDAAPVASQSEPAPASEPEPSGTPAVADPQVALINASGLTMLTKEYTAASLVVPEDLKTWTLEKARNVARWFMAWKTDKKSDPASATLDDLTSGLEALEGFAGLMEGVQTGVETLKTENKAKTPAPVEPAPEATSDANAAEEAAVDLVEDQLGGVVIGHEVTPDAKCEVCGEPVDDPDIATLSLSRFKKALCVKDYKSAVADARK